MFAIAESGFPIQYCQGLALSLEALFRCGKLRIIGKPLAKGVATMSGAVFSPGNKSVAALIRHPQRSVTISERREPGAYYQNRPGLCVEGDFRKLVVATAKPVEAGKTFALNECELDADSSDSAIERGLPESHFFDVDVVCAVVAEMIESGQLDKKCWYLLYTSSCVVNVFCSNSYLEWIVFTHDRDNDTWDAGDRVLSPA